MFATMKARFAADITPYIPAFARRFLRHERGATAIEFGMVMLPFLTLLVMTMETALVFLAQQSLETAVSDAGRKILTGQAQGQNLSASAFKEAICAKKYVLFNCTSDLYVDVKTYPSFSSVSNAVQFDGAGKPITQYQPGAPGDIVVTRLMYNWPIISPLAQTYLANASSTKRWLVATAAFRNEPGTWTWSTQ